jgi:shikimate dehydrogenase
MREGQQITGKTRVVGVWGHPVSHSRSPVMHNAALAALGLDWVYVPFDVDPIRVEAAVAAVRALGLIGINVTVPLKEAILPYLDEIDPAARVVGSVNTIHNRDGRLYGTSTDGPGFLNALRAVGQDVEGRRVYLLGAGGSARAVAFALAARGVRVQIANRTAERAAALAAAVNGHYPGAAAVAAWGGEAAPFDLLVNTTSLGMSPQEDALPELPPNAFRDRPFVYDLIYAPPETRLLRAAREAGCGTSNGVGMLVQQGALSLALWTGLPLGQIPVRVMERAVKDAPAGEP